MSEQMLLKARLTLTLLLRKTLCYMVNLALIRVSIAARGPLRASSVLLALLLAWFAPWFPVAYAQDAKAIQLIAVETITYQTPRQALEEAARLRSRGWLGARVIMLRDGKSRPWYVVIADTPSTMKEARAIVVALGKAGLGANITRHAAQLVASRTVQDPAAPALEISNVAVGSPGPGKDTGQANDPVSVALQTPNNPLPGDAPQDEVDPFTITERDRVIMLARAIQRQGDLRGSLTYWREALSRWPDDADVLDAYLEVLIDLEDTANAEKLLHPWLDRAPDNQQALRQMGRLEMARNRAAAGLPYFERLIQLAPANADHAADYAYALLEAGERVRAIEAISRAHDLRPTAESGPSDALAELLAAYRPHLKQEVTWLSQQQGSTTMSWAWALDTPVTDNLRMTLLYDLIESHSPAAETTDSFSREIQEKRIRLDYNPVSELTWRVGVGQSVDNDTQTETSQEAGVIWNLHRAGSLAMLGQRGRPWYNTVDAARLGGNYEDIILDYTTILADVWRLDINGGLRRYVLGSTTYGTEHEFIATMGRQLFAVPEVVVSYQFQRSRFFYQSSDDDPLPVVMLEREDVHGLILDINEWLTPFAGWFVNAGVQQDVFKHSPSTSLGGGVRLRVGHRLEFEAGYTYQTDTDTANGGYAHTIKTLMQYTF